MNWSPYDTYVAEGRARMLEEGRRFLTEETPAPSMHAINHIELAKVASVRHRDLFTAACLMRPEDPFGMYEEMGGQYKVAGPVGDAARAVAAAGMLGTGLVGAHAGHAAGRLAGALGKRPLPQPTTTSFDEAMKSLFSPADMTAGGFRGGLEAADAARKARAPAGTYIEGRLQDVVGAPKSGLGRVGELLSGSRKKALEGAESTLLQHAGGVAEHRIPEFQQHARTVSQAIENEAKNVTRARGLAGGALGGLAAGGAVAAGVAHNRAAQEAARKALMAKGLLGAGGLAAAGLLAHHALSDNDQPPAHQGAL